MGTLTSKKDKTKFYGHYYKQYTADKQKVFGIIPGIAEEGGTLQVITDKKAYNFTFPTAEMGDTIKVGNSEFTNDYMKVDLPDIKGELHFSDTTPIAYDFMGFLKYLPLEDRHSIISIRHRTMGKITVEGEEYDFDNGYGYHECDSGEQFPAAHMWIQCNSFDDPDDTAIVCCIAQVPVLGIPVRGSIAIINRKGHKENRLSTYFLALTSLKKDKITLWQFPNRKFVIDVLDEGTAHGLVSASNGNMTEELREANNAHCRFRYYKSGKLQFDLESEHVGYERRHL